MTNRLVWRRSALGTILAIVAANSGCRWVPVRPAATAPADPAATAPQEPSAAASQSVFPELPPLTQTPKLQPISDEQAFPIAQKTEILDAAALRDNEIQRTVAEAVAEPNPFVPPEQKPPVVETPKPVTPVEAAESPPAETPNSAYKSNPQIPDVPPDPSRAWRAEIDHLLEVARLNAQAGGEQGEVWSCRERVLTCLAGPADSSLWKTVVFALATPPEAAEESASPKAADPSPPPANVISELRFCRKIIGFGKTEPLASEKLKAGQEVLLYTESEGLGIESAKDGFRSRLSSAVSILSDLDGRTCWARSFEVEDWCQRRRRDFFVGYNFTIPPNLAPGSYQIRLTQRDLVTDHEATKAIPLVIAP